MRQTKAEPLARPPIHLLLLGSMLGLALLITGCASSPRPDRRPAFQALSEDQSSDIAIHALGLVGTPYRYGGNTPDSGFDCSGLIGYVYKASAGVAPPRTVAQLADFGGSIDASEVRTGDLVLFGGNRPFHAGIFVGEGRFVHAPSTGGRVRLDRLSNPYWQRQGQAFRRP
jgi:cell wall-associated NlpC family hydrolase